MIVNALLAEQSVSRMFLAGVGPGILLSLLFAATVDILARTRSEFVFVFVFVFVSTVDTESHPDITLPVVARKAAPIGALMGVVLGGLYGGFLNPTEAGAFGALVIAIMRGSLDRKTFWNQLVETGQITVSVLFLILAATFFSRMLAQSGVPRELAEFFLSGSVGTFGFLLLIMLPIALPIAISADFDLIWFGVLTVVAVEMGLLTPPFGLSVYTIKSAMDDPDLKVGDIFRGALPFVAAMVVALVLIAAFPSIATWLARL